MNHEDHDDREGHGIRRLGMRLPSPLAPEVDDVVTRTIGCAIAVHRVLGPGYLESIYRRAMQIELERANLTYETERPVRVSYRGIEISGQRVDLIVEHAVVVELKSVQRLDDVHRAQVISYMRTTGLRAGLLINFRVPVLSQGLKRFVL